MVIKDKEIIEEGVKLFYTIRTFRYACSDYFKFKRRDAEDDAIQEFLELSEPQLMFLSTLWKDPKYSESYKKDPWVIIETDVVRWLEGDMVEYLGQKLSNPIKEKFGPFEEFRVKFTDFMYLRFQSKSLTEIQDSLDLSHDQLMILLSIFNDLSKKIIADLEYRFFNGV